MNIRTTRTYFALLRTGVIAILLALTACGLLAGAHPHAKPKHAIAKYHPDAYVLHLSMAKLALAGNYANTATAAPHLDVVEEYTAQKKRKKVSLTMVVIEYDLKGENGRQQLIAPVALNQKTTKFPALLEIMGTLGNLPYVLHDVRVVTATIEPTPAIKFPSDDASQARSIVEGALKQILDKTTPLKPVADVEAQIRLARFFMDHRFKEAAYLSVENAKQKLAAVSSKGAVPKETVKALTEEIEALESQLRKTMPFTLAF